MLFLSCILNHHINEKAFKRSCNLNTGSIFKSYLGSVWAVGIPVGAIFILWRLSSRSREITAESLVDQYGLDINADHPVIEKDNDTENV